MHTPGHTPGSQCFHVEGCLVSGDTLFLEGCGRTDLPGSNPEDMYHSLKQLASLPEQHDRVPGSPVLAAVERIAARRCVESNYVFKPKTQDAWMQWFGGQ